MIAPDNYESLSDKELLEKLTKMYGDADAAKFALGVLRGTNKQEVQ